MSKTKPIEYSRTHGVCIALGDSYPGEDEYRQRMKDNTIGVEPPGGDPVRSRAEATRTTSRPWGETDNRKPYMPTEDVGTPPLEEGLSFRQSF
jgi:hypothetical protein